MEEADGWTEEPRSGGGRRYDAWVEELRWWRWTKGRCLGEGAPMVEEDARPVAGWRCLAMEATGPNEQEKDRMRMRALLRFWLGAILSFPISNCNC